jgi:hypothetical protein
MNPAVLSFRSFSESALCIFRSVLARIKSRFGFVQP